MTNRRREGQSAGGGKCPPFWGNIRTMSDQTMAVPADVPVLTARDWVRVLAAYREPNHLRSTFELAVTLGPLVLLFSLALWALSVSYLLAAAIAVVNAGFLLRAFAIQHDCGHASFFRNRHVSDWVGRGLGVLTLTPYDVWRRSHSIHHASSGNLGKRGIGDVLTLTVGEYYALSAWGRLRYRLYRHPLVLFGLGRPICSSCRTVCPSGSWARAGATGPAQCPRMPPSPPGSAC